MPGAEPARALTPEQRRALEIRALARIELQRREPIRSLAAFVRRCWPAAEPGKALLWSWHMEAICEALEAQAAAAPGAELVICQPPRTMKSLLVNVFFPAWLWLRDPGLQFLSVSNSDALSIRDSLRMRRIVASPAYRELIEIAVGGRREEAWGLSPDQAQKQNFQNTKGGSRLCLPIGGRVTGQGCDWMLIDDPHDAKEAVLGSPERIAERMAETVSIHDQALMSRFNAGGPKKKVVVMQRLHEGDLAGTLIKRGAPTLILPMRFDPSRADPRDRRTEAGELLVSETWLPMPLDAWETALGAQASGQLDQAPVAPGGGMFPIKNWRWLDRSAWPSLEEREIEASGWDLAFGASEAGAFHVGIFGFRCRGRAYLDGIVRGRFEMPELLRRMREARDRWPGTVGWYLEDRAAARPAIEMLQTEIPGLVKVQPRGDKVARAQGWQPWQAAGSIVLPCQCGRTSLHAHEDEASLPGEDWAVALVTEHAQFPKGALKDQVDADGYLLNALLGGTAAIVPELPDLALGEPRWAAGGDSGGGGGGGFDPW